MPDRYFLLGAKVGRSPTPRMMNSAFRALGLDAVYSALDVGSAEFESTFRSIMESGDAGMNVTMPHKRSVIGLLNSLDADASRTGAVNTVKNDGGMYRGYNTDVHGIIHPLRSRGVRKVSRAAVFGAGGAARAFAGAVNQLGCQNLTVVSRHPEAASAFLLDMTAAFPSMKTTVVPLDSGNLPPPEVFFNATPCGSDGVPVPPQLKEFFGEHTLVFDAVYLPVETGLVRLAEERGCQVIYGHEMLLQQGVEAFRVWTGAQPPASLMRESLMSSLEVHA